MPLAALAFALSIAFVPHIPSEAVAPRVWVLLVGAPLVMLIQPKVTLTIWHWLGMAVLAVAGASLFWSVSRLDTYMGLAYLSAASILFCIASQQEDLTPVWLALGLGAAVNAVAALWQWPSVRELPTGLGGLFYHQDYLGAFAALSLVALLTGTGRAGSKPAWIWLLVLAAALDLALAGARGAIFAALAGLLAWGAVMGRPKATALAGLACVAMAGVLFMTHHRFGALIARWAEWKWILVNLKPLGWGWNTLGSIFPFEHADNDYLEMVVDLGVLAIIPLGFIALVLRRAKHAPTAFAVLTATLVDAITSSPMHQPATLAVTAICLGALCHRRPDVQLHGRSCPNAGRVHSRFFLRCGAARDLRQAPVSLSP